MEQEWVGRTCFSVVVPGFIGRQCIEWSGQDIAHKPNPAHGVVSSSLWGSSQVQKFAATVILLPNFGTLREPCGSDDAGLCTRSCPQLCLMSPITLWIGPALPSWPVAGCVGYHWYRPPLQSLHCFEIFQDKSISINLLFHSKCH